MGNRKKTQLDPIQSLNVKRAGERERISVLFRGNSNLKVLKARTAQLIWAALRKSLWLESGDLKGDKGVCSCQDLRTHERRQALYWS